VSVFRVEFKYSTNEPAMLGQELRFFLFDSNLPVLGHANQNEGNGNNNNNQGNDNQGAIPTVPDAGPGILFLITAFGAILVFSARPSSHKLAATWILGFQEVLDGERCEWRGDKSVLGQWVRRRRKSFGSLGWSETEPQEWPHHAHEP
jgi:hypothetical protein